MFKSFAEQVYTVLKTARDRSHVPMQLAISKQGVLTSSGRRSNELVECLASQSPDDKSLLAAAMTRLDATRRDWAVSSTELTIADHICVAWTPTSRRRHRNNNATTNKPRLDTVSGLDSDT